MPRAKPCLSELALTAVMAGLLEAQFHILRGPQIPDQRELATRRLRNDQRLLRVAAETVGRQLKSFPNLF